MKLNDYGFKAKIEYRKAGFTGSKKRRAWTSTSVGIEQFVSEFAFRDFLRQHDVADMLFMKVEMSYHSHCSFSCCYENVYLSKMREGKAAHSLDGISSGAVILELNEKLVKIRKQAKEISDAGDIIFQGNKSNGYANRKGSGFVFYSIDKYQSYYQLKHFYAIPAALKKNRTKFKKEGPKPDVEALYYKRHKSWL